MATSGSTSFTVTANDIINAALRALGVIAAGETAAAEEVNDAKQALNLLVKQWMGPGNIATPSLKMWKRKHLTLKLTSTPNYTLKLRRLAFTSGGTYTIAVGDTITGATSGATAVVMSVEVTSGSWADGDAAGELIINDQDGTFQSENLDVGSNSNVATISGDSEQYGPPTDILDVVIRTASGTDTPLDPMTVSEWMALGDKDASGTPQKYYYEKKADELRFYLDKTPSDTTYTIFMVVLLPIEDFDTIADNPDFPREWYRALKWNLAQELLADYPSSENRQKIIAAMATQSLAMANSFEPENVVVYFQPDLDI